MLTELGSSAKLDELKEELGKSMKTSELKEFLDKDTFTEEDIKLLKDKVAEQVDEYLGPINTVLEYTDIRKVPWIGEHYGRLEDAAQEEFDGMVGDSIGDTVRETEIPAPIEAILGDGTCER